MDWVAPTIAGLGALAVAGVTVWGSGVNAKRAAKAEGVRSEASFQEALNNGFKVLMEAHDRAAQVAAHRISELEGTVLNLTQAVESLEAYLRRKGIAVPKRKVIAGVRPLLKVVGGKVEE